MFCEPFDETQIAPDRPGAIVAALEFLEHDFAKVGHSRVPPVTHNLSGPPNLLDSRYRSDRGFVLTAIADITSG